MANRYAVVIVQPPGYVHSAAFAEVAETLVSALRALGQDAVRSRECVAGRRAIVLGSNLLPIHPVELPPDAVLYNLEQIDAGSAWLTPALLDLFRRHEVWDYSSRNAARYPGLGLCSPRVVPIGYVPELTRIAPAEEDIDVLFYGSLNERRKGVLEALSARGLVVHAAFGVYGEERDRLIARSKVVLNLHYYESKVFEVVRVSYLLANRRCVVSERGADPAEERDLEGGVAFAPYDLIVETCTRLCADPAARARFADEGFRLFSGFDARASIAEALGLPFAAQGSPMNVSVQPSGRAYGPTPPHAAPTASPVAGPVLPAPHRPPVPAYYLNDRPEIVARVSPARLRILDVGCAAGAMGAAMLAAGATEVAGIEVHAPAAALARPRLTAVYGYDLDRLPELPYPDGYFDVITLADVLEHLREPLTALRHLRRWLSAGGRIVCSIPNVRHESVLLPLLVQGRWDYVDAGILDRTHLRFFTVSSMAQLLGDAGFQVVGPAQAVMSPVTPALEALAALVATLGGDAARFRSEAQIVQLILEARPESSAGRRPSAIADPWRGSRPVRVLFTPDLADPDDGWPEALHQVVVGLGTDERITVGVALPLGPLEDPPVALRSVAERAGVDLLLTEAPSDPPGWERLFGGASVWMATSDRPDLRPLAERVGLGIEGRNTPEAVVG